MGGLEGGRTFCEQHPGGEARPSDLGKNDIVRVAMAKGLVCGL